jgi:hypothetical protein
VSPRLASARVRSAWIALLALGAFVACRRGPAAPPPEPAPTNTTADITEADLRARLFALAHDSMMGRASGSEGDFKATQWVASEFARFGLRPAGDVGTWYQTLPFTRVTIDPRARLEVAGRFAAPWRDWILLNATATVRPIGNARAVYGGRLGDSAAWPAADSLRARFVIFDAPAGADWRTVSRELRAALRSSRTAGAAAVAVAALELVPPEARQALRGGRLLLGEQRTPEQPGLLIVSHAFADTTLRGPARRTGATGEVVSGDYGVIRGTTEYPARNVIGILEGSDPVLRHQYVSITAHNDHVGFGHSPVDHDSLRAFDRVVRPLGADSPDRPATAAEMTRIRAILDSLRKVHRPRQDSIFNGADDDGSGTVAILEIAQAIAALPKRPKRSILFVSHTAEENGLLGSQWFTDHPTVPLDSIVAEMDLDMIGRGGKDDNPEGGPAYMERVGARRLSTELGDILDAVNRRQPLPFAFNDTYDAPDHPLQYYCRADHYSYARYGIPSVSLSRGEHLDYHQVTDEAQYIDYPVLARVARFVRDVALTIGDMDHRPLRDKPKGDPRAPCRQ